MNWVTVEVNPRNNWKGNPIVKVLENPLFNNLAEFLLTGTECPGVCVRSRTNGYFAPVCTVFKLLVDSLFHRLFNVSCEHMPILDLEQYNVEKDNFPDSKYIMLKGKST